MSLAFEDFESVIAAVPVNLLNDHTEITLTQGWNCNLISTNRDKHDYNIYRGKMFIQGEMQRCIKTSNIKKKKGS